MITVGAEQEPPVLNPLLPGGANDIVRAIGQAILAGAHDVDAATGQLRPDLVETLPTVRNGGVRVVGFQRIAGAGGVQPFSEEAFAQYQALVADMHTTADIDRARELAVEAEQVLADIVAFIPLVSEPVAAARWIYVGGLEPEQSARIFTSGIEQWFRADPWQYQARPKPTPITKYRARTHIHPSHADRHLEERWRLSLDEILRPMTPLAEVCR